ncbi:hypothetical protein MHY87_05240 [Microvirga sp. ACRRW]|uniref:hypothetical protein n=1 Tax=Microvirga sp. ACRRW TaxID=2918205 RepID=UPI001EF6D8E8|nr:hypothetical protein [Microvirga sp. ACRRW]MCG7392304.1 hypothetical protein [Microvirga sp. ACRRW]
MRRWIIFPVLLAFGASFSPSIAEERAINKTVVSGKTLKVTAAYFVNPDCSSPERPDIRFISSPSGGTISLKKSIDFPRFPESNLRFRCNTKKVSSHQIFYQPARGFIGKDRFSFKVIYPDGHVVTNNATIDVIE